jgi:hypothetical protein
MLQSRPGQKVCEILSGETLHKHRAGGVAQGEGPEFKPQYCKKKKKKKKEKFLMLLSAYTAGSMVKDYLKLHHGRLKVYIVNPRASVGRYYL